MASRGLTALYKRQLITGPGYRPAVSRKSTFLPPCPSKKTDPRYRVARGANATPCIVRSPAEVEPQEQYCLGP